MSKNVFCYAERKGQLLKGGHNMRCAADFRAEARAALKGRWGLAIGIGFLAMVLGGIAGVGGLDVNFVMVEGNFQMTLDIFGQRLNPVEMMRNIGVGSAFLVWQYLSVAAALVAIVRLIVGSFVGVGYMKADWKRCFVMSNSGERCLRLFYCRRCISSAGRCCLSFRDLLRHIVIS